MFKADQIIVLRYKADRVSVSSRSLGEFWSEKSILFGVKKSFFPEPLPNQLSQIALKAPWVSLGFENAASIKTHYCIHQKHNTTFIIKTQ